jgi:glutaredoxin
MAKEYLEKKGITFSVVDVSRDAEAAGEMVEKSGQMGVPVLEVGGTVIVGYDREAYRKSLQDAGLMGKHA